MTIWHLVFRVDSLTYTIAKALSHGGHDVCIWLVEPKQDYGLSEGIYTALRETPRVGFIGRDEARLPPVIERLIVQAHPRPLESTRDAPLLAKRARKITLISAGDRNRSRRSAMKLQWLEARRLWRQLGKVDRILYKDGFHSRDLLGMIKRRSNIGFDVHSQFLHNDELFRMMHGHDWDPAARRPILVNFLGCRDPDIRARILDTMRPFFQSGKRDLFRMVSDKPTFWHEYTNASYSLVTHRPIEALLRGSIPVLASTELDLYGVELKDHENCIGVPDGQWAESIRRLARIEERDLIRMRNNARAMFDDYLSYDAVARRLRSRVGGVDLERESVRIARHPGAAVAS